MSDFGESFRFRKVLQGQEILSFNTSYDGIDAQNHHPLEIRRCFPVSNGSRISYESIGFGESFRSDKVLQGQETFSNSLCGRVPAANQVQENSGRGITDGVGATSSGNGWSALMQGYNTIVRPSARLIQVSSPSSVLMFQQANTPAPNFHAIYGVNNQEHEISSQTSFNISETCGGKLASSSPCEHSLGREGQQGIDLLKEQNRLASPHPALATRSSYRDNQDLASTCKSSCRLFGFPLTEGRHTINKEDNPSQVISPFNSEGSFLSRGEEQLHPNPPLVTKVVGSSCTKVNDFYAVRDRLLDIAL
uniref:Putative auxin response factor 28 n=1 Tax=Davidia involucrata TaxID=16924 RepID=A0A5B7BF81_DAVIN